MWGSHLVAFGAGGSPDARLTRQPWDTGHARGARVPGAASVTLAKRGDKAGTGRAGDKARRGHSPLCHHQRHQEPPRAPLTFCPFSPASPGLPWGNAGMSQAGASPPKTGTAGTGGTHRSARGATSSPFSWWPRHCHQCRCPLEGLRAGRALPALLALRRDIPAGRWRWGQLRSGGTVTAPLPSPSQRCPVPGAAQISAGEVAGTGQGQRCPQCLTFSPLSPRAPGSPFSPGIPCTENPQQR